MESLKNLQIPKCPNIMVPNFLQMAIWRAGVEMEVESHSPKLALAFKSRETFVDYMATILDETTRETHMKMEHGTTTAKTISLESIVDINPEDLYTYHVHDLHEYVHM